MSARAALPASRRLLARVAAIGALAASAIALAVIVVLTARAEPGLPEAAAAGPRPGGPMAAKGLTVTWAGDTNLGSAGEGPAASGWPALSGVARLLRGGDVTAVNLEGTFARSGSSSKCPPVASARCFAFAAPATHAGALARAGIELVNLANNHAWDYGATGMGDTVRALEARRIGYTGRPGEIRVRAVRGRQVAFVGFSTYPWSASMLDLAGVRALVAAAARRAPVVVAFFHGGAEGVARTRTPHGPERYLGEERGDVRAFAHAAIGAGADLVLGSGPHVLRGLELHRRRLIAYSLGNLAGGVFRTEGLLGVSAVLRVRLGPDGRFRGGRLFPLRLDASGVPHPDPTRTAARVVTALGAEDFPGHAVAVGPKGRLRRAPRGRTAA